MGLFVVVVIFGKSLSDDKLRHVDFVLEEVGDGFSDVARSSVSKIVVDTTKEGLLLRALDVTVYEDLAKTSLDHVLDQSTIVSSYRLDTFAVHFVIFGWFRPI